MTRPDAGPVRDDRGSLGIAGAVGLRAGSAVVTGVVFGGPSPEHDVSILTGLQSVRTLQKVHLVSNCRAIYWSKTGEWFEVSPDLEGSSFMGGVPVEARPLKLVTGPEGGFFVVKKGRFSAKDEPLEVDVVVNCCHGGPGEDGTLQGALDLAGIPYTGPNVAGAAIGMDKFAFGSVISSAWLPSLPRQMLTEASPAPGFPGPYIIKPRFGGSSIGIDIVADITTAKARLRGNRHLRQGAVIEPYRPDLFDLQVAVRAWPDLELSAIERPLKAREGGEILGYADKYIGGQGMAGARRELPAQIGAEVERQIRASATEIASLCGIRGIARIDFLSDGDALYVNEVNTIPGSLSRYLFVDPPLSFSQLLLDMVGEALSRPAFHYSVAGADGSALGGAGTIAGKLA